MNVEHFPITEPKGRRSLRCRTPRPPADSDYLQAVAAVQSLGSAVNVEIAKTVAANAADFTRIERRTRELQRSVVRLLEMSQI